ncbi:hypothetical protein EVAR_36147_1 [Eumeta japonica]|uniref:Uncharacterized protein n=1 Tax=Eumeta variegata TaxID=151549 RepID=A0A4C1X5K9_EUMVA|nr:hypothetical protein EVAR_36147_1 [Eumeta japonica]
MHNHKQASRGCRSRGRGAGRGGWPASVRAPRPAGRYHDTRQSVGIATPRLLYGRLTHLLCAFRRTKRVESLTSVTLEQLTNHSALNIPKSPITIRNIVENPLKQYSKTNTPSRPQLHGAYSDRSTRARPALYV